jgi:hypothetical protein
MANITFRRADGTTAYLQAVGSGTDLDPYRPAHHYLDAGPEWATLHKIVNSADMSAPTPVCDTPGGGLCFVLVDLVISTDTPLSVTLTEETSGTVLGGPYYLPANSTMQLTPRSEGAKTAVATKRVMAQANRAGHVTVETFGYTEVAS